MAFEDLRADFDLLDEWEDKYRYVMDLGKALPELPQELRTEQTKVRGCASQVWLVSRVTGRADDGSPVLHFDGDSDAHLVKGLVAILLSLVQDKSAREVLQVDAAAAFAVLGLKEHLTPQRSNGLASMIGRIRQDASEALRGR
ncbi:MAG: SufE family protein [Hyphomicrobiaceae bacterium]|nr:SufE family protein [Hyphomicrobiaceae bacterium]